MGREDRLTEREEGLRDRLAGSIIDAIVPPGVHPTHITCARLAVVLVCVVMHHNELISLVAQVNVLVGVALADTVDGVLARVRGKTTPIGAMLDHVTDWVLGFWLGWLALMNGLLSGTVVALMVLPQLLLVVGERLLGKSRDRPVFKATALSRLQFVCVVAAFSFLITGYALGRKLLSWFGRVFLGGEIALAWYMGLQGMGRAVARLVSGRS